MDKQTVIERVRRSLKRHPIPDAELEVVEAGIRQDNGFWYVPVKPSAPLPRSFEFYVRSLVRKTSSTARTR
jgi:hypothetical protein